jgi:hypothetical protein
MPFLSVLIESYTMFMNHRPIFMDHVYTIYMYMYTVCINTHTLMHKHAKATIYHMVTYGLYVWLRPKIAFFAPPIYGIPLI